MSRTVPAVHPVGSLADALDRVSGTRRVFACVVDPAAQPLASVRANDDESIAIAVGPEGGFDAKEHARLGAAGATAVHIGPRVLPAWLAGAVALTVLLAER